MNNKKNSEILRPEDVALYPRPGMTGPSAFTFSYDDRLIAYLKSPDNSLTRQLYVYDLANEEHRLVYSTQDGGETEQSLSAEEKLRRERTRTRALGVTQYAWIPNSHCVMLPLNGNLYVLDVNNNSQRLLIGKADKPLIDPQCSPDGGYIAFVRDADLYVVNVNNGAQRQLTSGANGTGLCYGLAEYIAQEEMDRQHGFWWSPDSQYIAFTEVDERHIPEFRIVHQGKSVTGDHAQEDHRYPFAGEANAKIKLGVNSVKGGHPVWMNLGEEPDTYLARVQWRSDAKLFVQVENREQTMLRILCCDPLTGQCRTLLEERNPVWINLHNMLKPLRDGRFIWASERTGYMHLYLYNQDGTLNRQLTAGNWMVESIVGVDEKRELVYYMGTADSVLENHLYVVALSGGYPQRLTEKPGYHTVQLDHAKKRYIDTFSTPELPPQTSLNALDNGIVQVRLYSQNFPLVYEETLTPPAYIQIPTPDGVNLHGMIYRPPATCGKGPYPTIISVYGGPHAQQVTKSWSVSVDLRSQYLSSLGYLVFKVDNRGSARRGQAFEGAIKHNMGDIEVHDQVAGVRWLIQNGLADPARIGIYGWSYGGYMALMCLARAPEIFRVAVAGAPVTHWDGYDTHYTERYMGQPELNSRGYNTSSVMAYVEAIAGKLMIVHGLIDENVHFRHTARLINALIHAGKAYDLLLFPDERHMPRGFQDRVYLENRIGEFFLANL